MTVPLPHLPLARLRASRSDVVRPLLERSPQWGHLAPYRSEVDGERGVVSYRTQPGSFCLQVRFRRVRDEWHEGEVDVVPGSVVALRLVLDDVDPAAVTRSLELAPSRAFAKGDVGPLGRAVREEGLWIHEVLPDASCFPEEKVAELLALLRGRAGWARVLGWRGVRWAGITAKLRCPIERPGGIALEPRVLEDFAGLSLAFDLELTNE